MGYHIYVKEKGQKHWNKTTKSLVKTKSHAIPDLTTNHEYEAQVTAVNELGESEPSAASKPFTVSPAGKRTKVSKGAMVWLTYTLCTDRSFV